MEAERRGWGGLGLWEDEVLEQKQKHKEEAKETLKLAQDSLQEKQASLAKVSTHRG